MDGSYIKLSRGLLDWEWYSDINTTRVFIHMLLKANWRDGNFKGVPVPRGSFVSSIGKLASETGLTEREIRTAILHLKTTGEVTSKTTNKFTVFSVVKYDLYQASDKQNVSQEPSKRHSNDIQTTTIEEKKERKKGNKEKNTKKEFFPDDEKLNQAFADFVDMRKQIKAPMTDRAIGMAIKKLTELSGGNYDTAVKILEQSIMNSWKGLFQIKDLRLPAKKNAFNNFTPRDNDLDDLERKLLNNGLEHPPSGERNI